MALRQLGRPVVPPKPVVKTTPALREQVRKPEPALRPPPVRRGLDAPVIEKDEGKENYTSSFRMTKHLNTLVERIMEKRDCRKSDAIKYAIRVVGHALQYGEASLTIVNEHGETEVTPLMRSGEAC